MDLDLSASAQEGREGAEGVKGNYSRYMPQLLEAFAVFEMEQPEAGSLQAFRYQVAQAYWNNKDWKNTRAWLQAIVEKAGTSDSFYGALARERLRKVEY